MIPSKIQSILTSILSPLRCAPLLACALAASHLPAATVITSVDTSLSGSEKFVLKVGSTPFFYNGVQLRDDYARYQWGWNAAQIASLYAQAAKDGFTVVNSQLLWYDVEKTKDVFDWTILDSLIAAAETNNLKLELLWFGTQSDGCVQYVGVNNTGHLRVPDYVLTVTNGVPHSPYQLAKHADGTFMHPRVDLFQMEMCDDNLIAREKLVLAQISAHIASYDSAHGNKHTVVGFQILNEAHVGGNSTRSHAAAANALFTSGGFSSESTFNRFVNQRYISGIAAGIKSSNYSVWTRANLHGTTNWISNNESARNSGGTNLDFLGPDGFVPDAPSVMNSVSAHGYAVGKNYAMIMETGGIHTGQEHFPIAALAGNTAYNIYHFVDLSSKDALYIRSGTTFSASGSYVANVRNVNLMLAKDKIDLATKKNKAGLFVYNAVANSSSTVTGLESIRFSPASTTDQGIAIRRSGTEIVLMSTGGGTFQVPSSALTVSSAGIGSFDDSNTWVQTATKAAPLSGGLYSINMNPYDVVRLSSGGSGGGGGGGGGGGDTPVVYQAESATLGGGAAPENSVTGFHGTAYVNFPATGGTLTFNNVDGGAGGTKTLSFRDGNGGTSARTGTLVVNGASQPITFASTGAWTTWSTTDVTVTLSSGLTNTIRIQSTGQDLANIDELQVQ